ncbi:keratin, type I cytoskeletal 19-like [Narcine bancroftii]|uniref:keratin, type I cytoskeletal 19-like n=1 Tax=Narcine bancroftii TaxID=1343680 RepID=UPI0038320E06
MSSSFGRQSLSISSRSLGVPQRSFSSCSMQSYSPRSQTSLCYRGGASARSALTLGCAAGFGSGLSSGSFASIMPGGCVITDQKDTMKNLNDRLASYLEKVRTLDASNREMEKQILALASSKSVDSFDWSKYNSLVKPLQQQIINAMIQNAQIALETDNAKLAAEDFNNKWQTELMLRQSVEADIAGLYQLKDTYLQLQGSVTSDIAGLEDEIAYLKKNHAEEMKMLRQQKTQEVNVEVDSGPSVDLGAVLKELRDKYTSMTEKNQADLNDWYKEQLTARETQFTQNDQLMAGAKSEVSQLRHQMQGLEAEYNGLLGNLKALESTLCNTEASYAAELQSLQARIAQLEGELGNIRSEVMRQIKEYENLLNIKMKLETEISQYRSLLDGSKQSCSISGGSSSKVSQLFTNVTPERSMATKEIITESYTTRYN